MSTTPPGWQVTRQNLVVKAVEVSPNNYSYRAFDEDTGEVSSINFLFENYFSSFPGPVVQLRLQACTFTRSAACTPGALITPAVPIKSSATPPSPTNVSWNDICQPTRGGNYAEAGVWDNNSMYFNDAGKLEWSSHNILNETHTWSFGIVQFRADCSESTIIPLPGATVIGRGGDTATFRRVADIGGRPSWIPFNSNGTEGGPVISLSPNPADYAGGLQFEVCLNGFYCARSGHFNYPTNPAGTVYLRDEQSSSSCSDSTNGLVSWWKGEGNANDSVGGNNGSAQNGVGFEGGYVGQGFRLDGVDDYINIQSTASLEAIKSGTSIEGWIKPEVPNTSRGYIVGRRDPNVSESFSVPVYGDGKIGVIVRTTNMFANGSTWVTAPGVIQFGQWQHVAATFDGAAGQVKIYVNGQERALTLIEGTGAFGGDIVGTRNFFIGRRQALEDIGGYEGAEGAAYYKGLIDELSLYGRALTGSEVRSIFSASAAGKCEYAGVTNVDFLPYQSAGYRYLVIDQAAAPPAGYEQPSFDDSSWQAGTAAFGHSVGYCPLQATVHTHWPLDTQLLVRRSITLPADAANVRVMIGVDNDIEDVFFNGVRISTPQTHGDCPSLDNFRFDVPQSLIRAGDNTVAYRVSDRGGESFFDTRVVGDRLSTPTPSGTPQLLLSADGPAELAVSRNRYDPNPFTITTALTNRGTGNAPNVSLSLTLPAGLRLVSSPSVGTLGNVPPGQTRTVDWSVKADFQAEPITFDYSVTLRSSGTLVETLPRQLRVPALKPPVLFIPGVYGTELFKGDDHLWMNISRAVISPLDSYLDPLAFRTNLDPLDFSIVKGQVVRKIGYEVRTNYFTNRTFYYDYTQGLTDEFARYGYTEGWDFDTLPYDWRFGISDSSVEALASKIAEITDRTGSPKVQVIAHSTGGLLLKKYVETHPDNKVAKAIFVGVPNLGAPKAINALLTGETGIPYHAPEEMKKLAKDMPIVYDLAPSQWYYTVKGGYYQIYTQKSLFDSTKQDLNFVETNEDLVSNYGMNSSAVSKADGLHTRSFDNMDLRGRGIDVYNIVGCNTASIGKVIEKREQGTGLTTVSFETRSTPGDGTVPLESATNLPVDDGKKFYALGADHGKMPSQDGIRQQIVKIVTGNANIHPDEGVITQDISRCKLKGKAISIYSPVDIAVIGQDGNYAGPTADGGFVNTFPNVIYDVLGEHKTVFLPQDDGQTYDVRLLGTGNGKFTLKVEDYGGENEVGAEIFPNLPVTTSLQGSLDVTSQQTTLSLDADGNGTTDEVLTPAITVSKEQLLAREGGLGEISLRPPQASPGASTYAATQMVNLSAPDWDMIYYTTDGSTPLCDGTGKLYEGPISVVTSKAIKAVGCLAGGFGSQVESFTYTIERSAPLVSPPANLVFRTGEGATDCGVVISDSALGTLTLNDSWPNVTVKRGGVPADNIFPVGQTTLTYTASDSEGNIASASQTVTVVDNTPPTLAALTIDKPVLSPPNHKMVDITVGYTVSDNCGPVTTMISVTSNEPVNGTGDGDTAPDWQIVDLHHLRLRAERAGNSLGRVYTIAVTATDKAGNTTREVITVSVHKG